MFIGPCTAEAAKYAVMRWHYSKKMPAGKLVKLGVWDKEGGQFDGAIIYGRGSSAPLYRSFDAKQTEMVELVRVALRPAEQRSFPTSKAVSFSLRYLKKTNPGLGLVISFADWSEQQHVGTIYKATNWWYLGKSEQKHFRDKVSGAVIHSRSVGTWAKGDPRRKRLEPAEFSKYRYAYPLTEEWAKKIAPRRQPYPVATGAGLVQDVEN